jgi:hypothetical protein
MIPKRTPVEVFAALDKMEADDEAERILAMSPDEVNAELAAQGFDVPAVTTRGVEFVGRMKAQREIYERASNRLDRARAMLGSRSPRREKLPRVALLARLETVRHDPRFSAPAAILFRNRPVVEASDDELEQLADTLEALAEVIAADEADAANK